MYKKLLLLALMGAAFQLQADLESNIINSELARVSGWLKDNKLHDKDKDIFYDLAHDVVQKRNTELLRSTDVNDAVNDLKRFLRSGALTALGLSTCGGAIAILALADSARGDEARIVALFSIAVGLLGLFTTGKGISDFFAGIKTDTAEKQAIYNKKLQALKDAILIKQQILQA